MSIFMCHSERQSALFDPAHYDVCIGFVKKKRKTEKKKNASFCSTAVASD
jgi:hypothetical protein